MMSQKMGGIVDDKLQIYRYTNPRIAMLVSFSLPLILSVASNRYSDK